MSNYVWLIFCLLFFNSSSDKGGADVTMARHVKGQINVVKAEMLYENTPGKEKIRLKMTEAGAGKASQERDNVDILVRFDLGKIYFLDSQKKQYAELPVKKSLPELLKHNFNVETQETSCFLTNKVAEGLYTYYSKYKDGFVNRVKDHSSADLVRLLTTDTGQETVQLKFSFKDERPKDNVFEIPEGFILKK